MRRLDAMKTNEQLYHSMNQLGDTIAVINGLNGRVGRPNPKQVIKGMQKLTSTPGKSNESLAGTLSQLSGLVNMDLPEANMFQSLVSEDIIEKLISGEQPIPETPNAASEGIKVDPNKMMEVVEAAARLVEEENGTGGGQTTESPMDVEDIKSLLDQLK